MSSFDHRFRKANDDERRYRCTVRGCGQPVTTICIYDYVSSPTTGRVTTSRVGRCPAHADKFIKNYSAILVPLEEPA